MKKEERKKSKNAWDVLRKWPSDEKARAGGTGTDFSGTKGACNSTQ